MSESAGQAEFIWETHRNHFLFSDYYLDHRVRQRPEWQAVDARTVLAKLAGLWTTFTPYSDNEAQTEHDWIRPVLEVLGHTFTVQTTIQTPHGAYTPDYLFFPDEPAREAARARREEQGALEERDLRAALAVGDAKAWERPLDRASKRDGSMAPTVSQNPSFQIDFYMRHTGRPWGILTNGRHWRLYHTDTSKKLDVYYEVDLIRLIEQGAVPDATPQQIDAFKFFYLFFRRQAFTGDPAWLDLVLEESRAYEQGVSEDLKQQVYEALGALAQGFLDFPANDLQPTPATRQAIYDNSLIVLYRLLFTLYAEDRDLLPVRDNRSYAERYSLLALKQRIAKEMRDGVPAEASMDELWSNLRRLWRVLNTGNPDLDVPAYNGGLFDPEKHPFLERYRVGDSHLRRAIDLLARATDPSTGRREFVDYRDLEIRHLGNIYEGLLEYHLEIRDQRLEIDGGEESQSPVSNLQSLTLVTDKGERKATGSYYTPDYIVQYIVEHTVGPVLDEVKARYTDADGDITDEAGLVREVLALNILDPAMGSGHFLVAATDYIARYLVALGLETAPSPPLSPNSGGEELSATASPPPKLGEGPGVGASELAYWRRRVVQACIYGVDVNPLAVELAKLSLWLNTVARDRPLSFLDHHLRPGNSLIGARASDLLLDGGPQRTRYQRRKETAQREAGQLSMLDDSAFVASMRSATGFMDQIEALKSETVDDVQEAERIYQETVRSLTRKYRTLADVWTARHFGLELDDAVWAGLTQHVLRGGGFEVPQYAGIIEEARRIAQERRFFHWELEFPEVFFDAHGRLLAEEAGFDAVVGNPPYGDILSPTEKRYRFETTGVKTGGRAEVYADFIATSLEILGAQQYMGFIIPNTLIDGAQFDAFRTYVTQHATPWRIRDFRNRRVFADAEVMTMILILKNVIAEDELVVPYEYWDDCQNDFELADLRVFPRRSDQWHAVNKITRRVETPGLCVMLEPGIGSCHDAGVDYKWKNVGWQSRGERQRLSDVLFYSGSKQHPDDYPLLKGENLDRYSLQFDNNYLIHDWEKYRSPETTVLVYLDLALVPIKILTRQTSDRIQAAIDTDQFVTAKSVHTTLVKADGYSESYVLAILNSRLMTYIYRMRTGEAGRTFAQVKLHDLRQLPIRRIEFTTPADTRAALGEMGRRLYQRTLASGEPGGLLAFVEEQLSHEPERADVVHDLLAHLAEQMIDFHKQRQRIENALDPFKFLNRGVDFVKLPAAFADEIKYGELVSQTSKVSETFEVSGDLTTAHHDIDGLRLVPAGDRWELQVQLKLRDPDDDWQSWLYADDGHSIARVWVPAYRFELAPEKARYYQHAFRVLDQFANARSFPGGYTRTALKKLQLTRVPAYDPDADLTPLVELSEELAGVQDHIARTDTLIDQIVYRLYGLTEEEIAVVEGHA